MLSIAILSKVTTYTVRVTYSTYDTLVDPCDYLQANLADLVVKGIGLAVGTVTSCNIISVALGVNDRNIYTYQVTVNTTI
jgi:hypothetical protein